MIDDARQGKRRDKNLDSGVIRLSLSSIRGMLGGCKLSGDGASGNRWRIHSWASMLTVPRLYTAVKMVDRWLENLTIILRG